MIEMLEGMANVAPVGTMIQRCRQRAGLTQQEVADLSGVSVAGVRDLEQGRVTRPRVSTLRRLVEALGLSKVEFEGLLRSDGTARASGVRVEVLGPVRVIVDGAVTDLGSAAQGVLLGLLALAPNQAVGRDGLVEAVWGSRPPAAAGDLLQSRVSRLRRRLRSARTDAAVPVTATPGYQLDVTEDQLDLLVFRQKVAHARQLLGTGDAVSACVLFGEAMRLWRADPLAGLTVLQSHPVVTALVREWQAVVTEYAQAAAESGHYNEVLPLLRQAADTDPLHEGVHAGLMIVLAGAGQQAAALAVFDRLRRQLIEQLGADPGPELTAAHQRVLHREVARQEFVPVSAHGQLPPDITEFTGRQAELRVMHDQLPDTAAGSTAVVISSLEGMDGLADEHLAIAVTGDRYRLHDLLHDYAVQIAGTEEPGAARAAAITRVLDYFLHIAATASRVVQPLRVPLDLVGTPPAHHPRLSTVEHVEAWQETERASLVAAVVFAADHGHPERFWQLAESLHGGFTESEVLVDLGVVHRDAGRLDAALDMVGEAMALAVTTKERYQQARALDALAGVHDRAGHPDLAEDHWRRAYDLFAELGTPEADRIRPRLRSDVTAGVNVR